MKRVTALVGIITVSGCGYGLHLPLNTPFNDNNGQEIIMRDNPLLTPKASSTLYEGRYYLNYNPAYMRMRVHPDAQRFIFFHELGHIRLGHHGMYIYDNNGQRRMQTAIPARCSEMSIIILPGSLGMFTNI